MTIRLDGTIVPAKDKVAAAGFFAEIFGLRVKPGRGSFTKVQVNESLTFDFADEELAPGEGHHYAFHVSEPSSRGSGPGSRRGTSPTASRTTTRTAGSIAGGAGAASASWIPTAICSR